MATDDAFRGRGVGGAMLGFAENFLLSNRPVRLFWCNARTPAVRFYQKQGWKVVSEEFVIETAGPHVKMIKRT
jgi:GNAT superfamily N-acetyltransferase